jgi:hypothetical protein
LLAVSTPQRFAKLAYTNDGASRHKIFPIANKRQQTLISCFPLQHFQKKTYRFKVKTENVQEGVNHTSPEALFQILIQALRVQFCGRQKKNIRLHSPTQILLLLNHNCTLHNTITAP